LKFARSVTNQQLLILALLTVFWGLNWPIAKLGIHTLPPLWFRSLCVGGGTVILGLYAIVKNIDLRPESGSAGELVLLALTNMIVWYVLGILAISHLPSGRAAILGYTMPIWAALIGLAFYRERLHAIVWLGVFAALIATILLIAGEWRAMAGSPVAVLMMLGAALSWGWGTHLMRRSRLTMHTLSITFWMMVISSGVVFLVSYLLEGDRWIWPETAQWVPILYTSIFVMGLCNVAWFTLARSLPPVASGLSGMMIPVVGVFSSMPILGEVPQWRDVVALGLILVSLATVLLPHRMKAGSSI
jgi:drug/metabolite transporter (DMT)-like permease